MSVDDSRLLPSSVAILHDRCQPDLLRTFKMFLKHRSSPRQPVPRHLIDRLLRFKNLQEVDISTLPLVPPVDNTILRKMATAWPQLSKLRMPHYKENPQIESRITLSGLVPLAQRCPELEELQISLCITPPPLSIHLLPGRGLSESRLQTIEVHDSPVQLWIWAAGFLSGLFPELKTITSSAHRDNWEKVNATLVFFNQVRLQERGEVTAHEQLQADS